MKRFNALGAACAASLLAFATALCPQEATPSQPLEQWLGEWHGIQTGTPAARLIFTTAPLHGSRQIIRQ